MDAVTDAVATWLSEVNWWVFWSIPVFTAVVGFYVWLAMV